jgi:hypothetical protein
MLDCWEYEFVLNKNDGSLSSEDLLIHSSIEFLKLLWYDL